MTRHALSGTTRNFDLADNLGTAVTMMIDTTLNIRVSIIAVIGTRPSALGMSDPIWGPLINIFVDVKKN